MSYHVTNFQPCHWPLLVYVAFLAIHVLHCVLLEIALNAGSACVGRLGSVLSPTGYRLAVHLAFQNTVTDNIHSYIWRSTCGSYRIVSRYFVWYRIYRFALWLYRAITRVLSQLMSCWNYLTNHHNDCHCNLIIFHWTTALLAPCSLLTSLLFLGIERSKVILATDSLYKL